MVSDLSKILRQEGYRLTRQRQQILQVLTSQPQSVVEIISVLKSSGIKVDKVTVYRTLDRFTNLGIVRQTQFKDKTSKFELVKSVDQHHHHLVCDNCGAIEDVHLNEALLVNQVSRQTNFQVTSHSLEFFGLCTQCQ